MKKLVALILLISTPVFGDTNVTHLLPGQTANYEGYLFSVPAEAKLRLTDANLTYETNLNLSLTTVNTQLNSQVGIMSERITGQEAEIKELSSKSDSWFGKTGFFILGCLVTGLISYGVSRTTR